DLLNESNETFFVNLSSPALATITDDQGMGTIANDDPVVSIRISDGAAYEGNSGTTNVLFLVSLSAASGQPVQVNYATAHDSTAPNDLQSASGTLRFDPGETNQLLFVSINGDTRNENNETFFVNLSAPFNATLDDNQGLGTILNDEGLPSVSITDMNLVEGNAGSTSAVFFVRLDEAHSQLVSVRYATGDGTATANSDYLSTNGLINFSPGATEQTIVVRVFGDLMNESNETFFVNLVGSTNGVISDFSGVGTITNDDPVPAISITDITVSEGSVADFAVRLSAVSGQLVSVRYATSNGTAVAGVDYVPTNGLVTFNSGVTEQMITVHIPVDQPGEADEAFFINLSSPTNATLSDAQAVGTILEAALAIQILLSTNAVTVPEGATNYVGVRLSVAPPSNVVVTVTRSSGASSLAVSAGASLTFTPGNWNVAQSVTISASEDENAQNETAAFDISSGFDSEVLNATALDNDTKFTRITKLELNGNTVVLSFTTVAGQRYRVQRTGNLDGGVWTTVADSVAGTGGVVPVNDTATSSPGGRFYRIVVLPDGS
ncbi:MAG: hypothetical protein L0Y58_05055, partial [Verrucomicrobia subdivision 3 bacterium]|nr:hypothetical protein [Limisphaerales bacterium]